MSRTLDNILFYLTAPLRLFGRSRRFRLIVGGTLLLAAFFSAALWALDTFLPVNDAKQAVAKLPKPPDLKPLARPSQIIAPVAVSLPAIRTVLDNAAPRDLSGKSDNPVSNLLSKADVGITITRGGMLISGKPNEMTVTVPLTGGLKITGQLAAQAGNLTGALSGLLGNSLGREVGQLTNKVLDQNAEIRGQVIVRSRPGFAANWRLEPNLTAQVSLGDSALNVAGMRINVANEAKPLIDKTVNEQMAKLDARLRNDPSIERAAREQWTKMCRSIALGGAATGLPPLWLEMRPVRASAAQPQVDARNVTLTIGILAETRIVPSATKPACPFPERLELVPPMENGKLAVGVPIDVPFKELNKLLELQMKGRRFPEDKSGPVEVEVRSASLAAASDRLLISLRVKAYEKKSWFGLGAEATVHVWGKPALDRTNQTLRLTDISLAIESEAAFGLLGAAAQSAIPYLQKALEDNAQIDLKPFAEDARKKIAEAMVDFQAPADGVKIDAGVDALRLVGIEFDSTTLRVVTEAEGTVRVAVSKLPPL